MHKVLNAAWARSSDAVLLLLILPFYVLFSLGVAPISGITWPHTYLEDDCWLLGQNRWLLALSPENETNSINHSCVRWRYMVNSFVCKGHVLNDLTVSGMKDECFSPPGPSILGELSKCELTSIQSYTAEAKGFLQVRTVLCRWIWILNTKGKPHLINTKIMWTFRQLFK